MFGTGTNIWFKNGEYHRDGDKPAITHVNGNKCWYKNGKEYIPNFYEEFQILKVKYDSIKQILNV